MKRFLISRLSSLGDVTCSLVAAVALKKTYPESWITWIVQPPFKGIVESCKAVDEVIPLYFSLWPKHWPTFKNQYDAAFDLQGLFKSGFMIQFASAKNKLGCFWQREGAGIFTRKVIPDPFSEHVMEQCTDVVKIIGAQNPKMESWLEPTSNAKKSLQHLNLPTKYAIINAGAGWEIKRWPAKYFAKISEQLLEKGIQPIFIGGNSPIDQKSFQEVKSHTSIPLINLIGKTTSEELVALIAQATIHIGGDTGSTHISSALNTQCVSMYSPTHPKRTGPYHYQYNCLYNKKGLKFISPEAVWEKIKNII